MRVSRPRRLFPPPGRRDEGHARGMKAGQEQVHREAPAARRDGRGSSQAAAAHGTECPTATELGADAREGLGSETLGPSSNAGLGETHGCCQNGHKPPLDVTPLSSTAVRP